MKAAAISIGISLLALTSQIPASAALYGSGLEGYRFISLADYTDLFSGLSDVPLAGGLDLDSSRAYLSTEVTRVPSSQCVTTSATLFTNCQPFLTTLAAAGGSLNGTTILGLLTVARNTTTSLTCVSSVLDFLNQGCTCDLTVYNLLQTFPTTSVPQLVKTAVNVLAQLLCPSGLVSRAPAAAGPPSATPVTTPAPSFVPVPPLSSGPPAAATSTPTATTAQAASANPAAPVTPATASTAQSTPATPATPAGASTAQASAVATPPALPVLPPVTAVAGPVPGPVPLLIPGPPAVTG